jgi:transcriptional regulator with XRE-family HTH domain
MVEYDKAQMERDAAAQGLSLVGLAQAAGLSYTTVHGFFRGDLRIRPATAKKIARVAGYSLKRYLAQPQGR